MVTRLPALLVASMAASFSPGAGQTFGSLNGTIVDPLGAVLPNAHVALVQPTREARYEIRSDRSGQFEFQGLAAGEYQFEAQSPGFETYRSTVTIAAGQAVQRSIRLQIGRLHETVRILESDPPAAPPRPAQPYTEPACPAPPTTTVGGNLRPPRKTRDVKPDYPSSMRGSRRDATVVVDARVGLDGYLKDFQPHDPVDQPFYDALLLAVRDWHFSSTMLNCVPQEVNMTITAGFFHSK